MVLCSKARVIGIDTRQRHGSRRSRWRSKAAILIGMSFLLLGQVVAQVEPADDFRSLLERGFAMHQHADYAGALPLLERAWKLEPHDYFANLLVGIDLLRTDEPAESIAYLEEAARQRPKEDFPYEYLGEAQTHLRTIRKQPPPMSARSLSSPPRRKQSRALLATRSSVLANSRHNCVPSQGLAA
jgi:tetratricopeptide (TPR) repeat protein